MESATNDPTGRLPDQDRQVKLSKIGDPLERLNAAIDWTLFQPTLEASIYAEAHTKAGHLPYDPLLMFKILILGRYYDVVDEALEYQILDRVTWQRFLGLTAGDPVPDTRTISLFRERLTNLKLFDKLFLLFAEELKRKGMISSAGKIVDASFKSVPTQSNRRQENTQVKEEKDTESGANSTSIISRSNPDLRWMEKSNLRRYAYGITGLVLLCIVGVVSYINNSAFDNTGLDDAMNAYLSAVTNENVSGLVNLMPEEKSFRFNSYGGSSGNIMGTGTYTKDQVAADFSRKGELFFAIFQGNSQYRYRDRIESAPIDKWIQKRSVYHWQDGSLKSYVKWRREGDDWKLDEVGDTVP